MIDKHEINGLSDADRAALINALANIMDNTKTILEKLGCWVADIAIDPDGLPEETPDE